MPGRERLGDNQNLQRFGATIRERREQLRLTQDELAAQAGVSRPTVQRYELGLVKTPDPPSTRAIFEVLGLDVRRIPVILGWLTAEEMGLADGGLSADPTVEELVEFLADASVSVDDREAILSHLKWMLGQRRRTVG